MFNSAWEQGFLKSFLNIADVHRRLIILKMRVAQAFVVFAEQQYPKGTLVREL